MKFLRIILIASLALSTVTPSYSISLQPLYSWWNSGSKTQKVLLVGLGLCIYVATVFAATVFFINKINKKAKTRDFINDILRAPIQENNAQAQQAREIQQLQSLINSGYRVTTDPYFNTSLVGRRDLNGPYSSFLIRAIDTKPYLIPLLKKLGATPMLIQIEEGREPLFHCFEIAAQTGSPQAFNTLLATYPLSEAQWDGLIKYTMMPNISANILIPAMPAALVNNTYQSSTLLQHCVRNCIMYPNLPGINFLVFIQQLLEKGADPLIPSADGQTILDLLVSDIDDSVETEIIKKQLKTLMAPYIERNKDARIAVISNVTRLSIDPIKLCFDYEYDVNGDRLLELVNSSDQGEEVIHKKLRSVIQHGDAFGDDYIINKGDANGVTPLMYAAARGHERVVQELMDCGADIEACNKAGENVLFFSAFFGHPPVIKAILEQAVKDKKPILSLINKQCINDDTPLIQAVYSRKALESTKEATVRLLLEHGADATLRKHAFFGRDALHYTNRIENESTRKRIVALLEHPPRPAPQPAPSLSLSLE